MRRQLLTLAGMMFAVQASAAEQNRYLILEEPVGFVRGGPKFERSVNIEDFEVYSGRVAFDCDAKYFFVSYLYDHTQGVYIVADKVKKSAIDCVIRRATSERMVYRWTDSPLFLNNGFNH